MDRESPQRRHEPAPERGAAPRELALRVAFAHATVDAPIADRLGSLLSESGATVVAADSSPPPDGLIVLLSNPAFEESGWLPEEGDDRARLLPVRIGELDEGLVPTHLRKLNWIDWAPERPATSLGFIVTGLLSDPGRYRVSRQLAHEAAVWNEAGRPRKQLIGDRRRARRMKVLLAQLAADPIATPNRVTTEFVSASDRETRKMQRRRLVAAGAAVIAGITAFSAAVTAIPRIQANARISRAAIVTAGNKVLLDEMPEWSAANAADLLLEGTEAERLLGVKTLLMAMTRPWEISDFGFIDSAIAAAPYNHGSKGVVLSLAPDGSGLALVDVRQGRVLRTAHLPRRFESLDVSGDGGVAALAGEGVDLVELRSGHVRTVTTQGEFVGVRVLGGPLALWTGDGRLELMSAGGRTALVGDFESVLDVRADGHGGGTALVATAPGAYAIVDLGDRTIIDRARTTPGAAVGALSPDGRRAVVDSGDRQLWTFGAGAPRPTGIPTPVSLNDLAWAQDERLVVVSDSALAQVYFLPRGELIGTICAYAPMTSGVQLEPGGETAACGGNGRSFWRLPPAPREAATAKPVDPPRMVRSPYGRIKISGERERISVQGLHGPTSTPWSKPFDSDVTAAAFSPESHQVVFGSLHGSVETLGLVSGGTILLSLWQAPDRSPIVDLRWHGDLVAETASGQIWEVPTCAGCESSPGMIAAAKSRFSGCFSERQLEWIDGGIRDQLGLRECEPPFVIGEDD
jgi:WD40 repeat protein